MELDRLVKVSDKLFKTQTPKFKPFVIERFVLDEEVKNSLRCMKPEFGYGQFGEFIFYSRYSRLKKDGTQENWADCVIRVVEGTFSIRKDWYIKNNIEWNEKHWQDYAAEFATYIFEMFWLPPGRGLWAMGTDFIYGRGSTSLFNCAACSINKDIPGAMHWIMDMLMNGVGVGFEPIRDDNLDLFPPNPKEEIMVVIGDSREEWCDATKLLLESYCERYMPTINFDYSAIRPKGLPIRGFGGISSGPEPLRKLHEKIREFSQRYLYEKGYDSIMYKTDIANCIGCCVVAGNVRRSAELVLGSINDKTFINLKNYEDPHFAYRAEHGWMSNNTVKFMTSEDFDKMQEIVEGIMSRGEPGFANFLNFKTGRVGKNDNVKEDVGVLLNPCSEIILEDFELCNLSSTFPTRCKNVEQWLKSCEYATFYSSTVALLPTHRQETNKVIIKNRRIGVGFVDFTGWRHENGLTKVIKWMRQGYKVVREINSKLAAEAGVPESIRVTTLAPGGTIPKLAGRTSGIGYPTCKYTLRRIRTQKNSPLYRFLITQKIPHEPDVKSDNTEIFEYPIIQGPARPVTEVTIWEQAFNVVTAQREWSDNAVSCTIYFKPKWKLVKEFECETIANYECELEALFIEYGFGYGNIENEFRSSVIEETENVRIVTKFEDNEMTIKVYEYDKNHEENQIESVLACIAPLVKAVSFCPHSPKIYPQLPEEEITKEQYEERLKTIGNIDWSTFKGSDGEDEKFCTSEKCEIDLTRKS